MPKRSVALAVVLLISSALLFPGLGTFGLWDPAEARIADAARNPPSDKISEPTLSLSLQRLGFAHLGLSEWAGRFPLALCGLFCVALTGLLGMRLLGGDSGWLAALVLATCAGFLFHARQLTSTILSQTLLLMAWGGPLLVLLDSNRAWRLCGAGLGTIGLLVGFFASGGLLGVTLPIVALAAFLLVMDSHRLLRVGILLPACALVAWTSWLALRGQGYQPWLGAVLKVTSSPPTFDGLFRSLAYAMFPWSGIALVGLPLLLSPPSSSNSHAGRALVLLAVLTTVAAYSLAWIGGGKIDYAALPVLALAAGAALDVLRRNPTTALPFVALAAACGILIVARDLFLQPDGLFPPALAEGLKLPAELLVLGMRHEHIYLAIGILATAASLIAWNGVPGFREPNRWIVTGRRCAFGLLLSSGILFGALHAHVLIPALSRHFSHKHVLADLDRLRRSGEKLLRFRVAGRGADIHAGEVIEEVKTQAKLLERFRESARVWALVGANEIASLDQAARQQNVAYYVLNDSSSRSLLLSNQLRPGERDKNALRKFVTSQKPTPPRPLEVDFEGKVALLGFDLAATVERGSRFKITLYFEVKEKLPANYKLFLHFDQPSYRFHGDHEPLGGQLPTQHWTPGTYVIDEHEIDVPRMTTPQGSYQVYMGFWQGEKRFKVTEGPQDGSNRVKLGRLVVR